jgi:4-hydroxy-tetrahydrodipicolinate reductase
MLVWSSNFSVGVNIFFDLNRWLAEQMSHQPQYTPSITETHHVHKLDKPSGTAKTLCNDIMMYCCNDVPIESIREGEVPGTHEVKWDSEEDTIVITHIAKGRRGFALGAVLAAEGLTR